MFISYIKNNYYYIISFSIFLFLVFSELILKPFKLITLFLILCVFVGIILQNLNKTLKIQINIFLIISYFLIFLLDFKIEQIIFKSCVRGSCYQDYLFKNKEEDLKVNLLGKHFIKNQTFLPLSTYANDRILGSNENGYWPIFTSDRYGFNNKDDIYKLENFKNIIIGDSFAQNATVNYEKSIQGILNQKNFSTLSFGVGGNGPLLNLANFKEYTVNLNYQNLIYFFTEKNDLFYDLKLEKKILVGTCFGCIVASWNFTDTNSV